MENSSDLEEFVPPTPNIQPSKICSRINKASITSSKLAKKPSINDHNLKRKRLSPDCRKGKQRVKQVTLLNFLVKNNKSKDKVSGENFSTNIESSARINLLNKFEETEVKNNDVFHIDTASKIFKELSNSETKSLHVECETEICDEVSSLHLNSQNNVSAVASNPHNHEIYNKEKYSSQYKEERVNPNIHKLLSSACNLNTNMNFCNNKNESTLEHSNIYSGEKSNTPYKEEIANNTDKLISSACNMNTDVNLCDTKNETILEHNIHNREIAKDPDMSFSWMSDIDWEQGKESFEFSYSVGKQDKLNYFSSFSACKEDSIKFKVKDVKKDASKNEIRLVVLANEDSTVVKNCHLRGFWTDSIVDIGDTVHILNSSGAGEIVIDNDNGFLVVNPDFLISSTAVVSTLFCMRKAVLNYVLPQWSMGNNVMMIGSLVHDIFQKSVNIRATTSEEILRVMESVMKKRENLIALTCQDLSKNEIEEKICKYIPNIIEWINKHCGFNGRNSLENISIANVEDIEENVWCPKYGIKGKIDMTVSAQFQNHAASKIMPLELKTGRPTFSAEHIGQVNLYSLMMEERSKKVSDGLLLYLRDKAEMKVITANHNSKRGLIQLRNELASYIYKWVSNKSSHYGELEECNLPRPINNKRLCEKCPYILPCTVYQKAFAEDKILEQSHAMNSLIPKFTNHLTVSHMEYFLHWSRLLLLETTTTAEVKKFWTEDAINREKQGLCLSYLILDEDALIKEATSGYFYHTFIRSANNPMSADFKNSCLKEGDYVAISNQNNLDQVAVAMGYIIKVSEKFIELAIERNLKALVWLKGFIFRIDKQVSNSAAACVRNNLMLLMQEEDQANRLRNLIIDKSVPKFLEVLPKQIVLQGRAILKCLNKNQQKAILKTLMAEDYFLIKGMPGTGKTSTIVALVRLLVQMNISVLLTSYTHSAIDNILLKLKEHTDFVRIGPKYRIHPDILPYSFENLTKDFNTVDEYSGFMKERMVVATTCLGINHAIFKLRKFDVCIVDEASQINQIACLGPLFFAKKFILVGDEQQLPPLVLNKKAREKGMQESLFQRLQNSLNCMELTVQYRMNREIMRLCNELTYNGCLQCGSETISNQVLKLEGKLDVTGVTFPGWLSAAFESNITKSVIFLNTDNYSSHKSDTNRNDFEADIIILLLQFLSEFQLCNSVIGIIAPYRKQVDLIESKLKCLNIQGIEVNTVDQYQGRDKDVIIVSCAKPCDIQRKVEKVGSLLDDEKRLNVAISRARKKLILIGSKVILCGYKPFENLISCLKENQCIDVT